MAEESILNRSALDQFVLRLLEHSPDTWSTAKSLVPEILMSMKEHIETDIQKALDRLHNNNAVKRAFNNVGDKSYIVYRAQDEE